MTAKPRRKRVKTVSLVEESQTYFQEKPVAISVPAVCDYSFIISDDDKSRRGQWKEVHHEAYQIDYQRPARYSFYETLNAFKTGDWKSRGSEWLYDPIGLFRDEVLGLANQYQSENPPDWDRIARTVVPSLRNEFNTINFLLEFGDIPALGKSFAEKARFLKPKGLRNRLKRTANVEAAGRAVTDQFLEYQLGIDPLIGDIKTLNDNLLDLLIKERKKAKKIARAFDRLNSGLVGSASRSSEEGDEVSVYRRIVKEFPWIYGSGWVKFTANVYVTVKDHVRVRGSFGGPNPAAQLLDMLGVYPDLHTLWNAVPFSFLVDYVLPVGDTLESEYGNWSWQTVGLPGGGISLVEAMTSVKIEVSFNAQWRPVGTAEDFPHMSSPIIGNGFSDDYEWSDGYGQLVGNWKFYQRFFQPQAVLDGIDLKPDQLGLVSKPSDRQMAITTGIMHNALIPAGRKTSMRIARRL